VPGGFKRSLLANFAGTGWSALAQVVAIPLYIKFMGIESYGLIGFYIMLQAILQVLDFGLSPTVNREMARYSVQPERMEEARDLVRTLEIGYWLMGVAIGAVLVGGSGWLSTHWIHANSLPKGRVEHALMLMGILSVFQWPVSFYQGGLMGLHRQVLYNTVRIVAVTLNTVGGVLVLWLVAPTITVLLAWQVAITAIQSVVLLVILWKSLRPASRSPRFAAELVRNLWRFAAGMSGITVCALLLTQADKIILSKLLTLQVFAYYSIAGLFASGLSMIVTSVFNTIFPRFSALAATNESALRDMYHRSTQLMAVIIFPTSAVLAVFSTQILRLWTRNPEIARNAGPIATLLVIGSAINGLNNLPYALQLAYGWTSIGLKINVLLTSIAIPMYWLAAKNYGPRGAAFVWMSVNTLFLVISLPITHSKLLRGDAWLWLVEVAMPLSVVGLIAAIGRGLIGTSMSLPLTAAILVGLLFCATLSAALVSPSIRLWLTCQLSRAKLSY